MALPGRNTEVEVVTNTLIPFFYETASTQNSLCALGDCLELMGELPDGCVDMILCDLPYGTTACKWDSVIPFNELWAQYRRVCKKDGAIVLTASQPFTTALAWSNLSNLKYQWVWLKERPSNPQLAKIQPLKVHEDILLFSFGKPPYNPQGLTEIPESQRKIHKPEANTLGHCVRKEYVQTHTGYPKSTISFKSERGLHPTQKPVALMEYLIRTYTKEGGMVLNNCMGSGTTGVACANTGRHFIGIEKDPAFFKVATERIHAAFSA